ncbi:L-serine ammonia-lyase, iron-sulfur-dependent, subunit beta [Paenibacillaceae bacterium]|nr:L-serine ammonia-lyase, iron-sulfur-dependent, subunit beta [Paenibacillaceae bacterium]
MRFKDVFSIIGPGMVGPSSSHTAGAVRIGRTARHVFGSLPKQVEIILYGSFADTYKGHGTDLALAGGLLDMATDDLRIRDSLRLAEQSGIEITIRTAHKAGLHPNTASLVLRDGQREEQVTGCSIGGGSIEITAVSGFDVRFSAMYPTLLIFHADRAGMIKEMTQLLNEQALNIGAMDLDRKSRGGEALTVIETDGEAAPDLMEHIRLLPHVRRVCSVNIGH